jgi:hypothetical protein
VARHPKQVRTLVAHEPPAAQVLPDCEQALAAAVDIPRTYQRDGFGPAMAKFIALSSLRGAVPAEFADRPVNPAEFGLEPSWRASWPTARRWPSPNGSAPRP